MKSTQRFVATLILGVGTVTLGQGCVGQSEATKAQVRRIKDAANKDVEDSAAGPRREAKYLDEVGGDRASIAVAGGVDAAELTDDDLLRLGYANCELVAAGDTTWDQLRSNARTRLGAEAEDIRVRLVVIDAARKRLC